MATGGTSLLSGHKYINLETYRKDGSGVITPVWFAIENGKILVVTRTGTGKVKRLKNNKSVRFMPSGSRGQPKGQWTTGSASFSSSDELKRAVELRNKKYGIQAKLVGLLSHAKGDLVGIAITPE